MFGIKFFDRQKPRGFNYIPRHYDPEKERREQRRLELLGPDAPSVRRNQKANEEYVPGRMIRQAQAERRAWGGASRNAQRQERRTSIIGILGMLMLLVVLWYLFTRPIVL